MAEEQLVDEVVDDDQADLDMNEEVVEFASDDMDDSDFEDLPPREHPEHEFKVDSDSEDPLEESKSEDLRAGTKRKKKA